MISILVSLSEAPRFPNLATSLYSLYLTSLRLLITWMLRFYVLIWTLSRQNLRRGLWCIGCRFLGLTSKARVKEQGDWNKEGGNTDREIEIYINVFGVTQPDPWKHREWVQQLFHWKDGTLSIPAHLGHSHPDVPGLVLSIGWAGAVALERVSRRKWEGTWGGFGVGCCQPEAKIA